MLQHEQHLDDAREAITRRTKEWCPPQLGVRARVQDVYDSLPTHDGIELANDTPQELGGAPMLSSMPDGAPGGG